MAIQDLVACHTPAKLRINFVKGKKEVLLTASGRLLVSYEG